jgi:hypothetical protein
MIFIDQREKIMKSTASRDWLQVVGQFGVVAALIFVGLRLILFSIDRLSSRLTYELNVTLALLWPNLRSKTQRGRIQLEKVTLFVLYPE